MGVTVSLPNNLTNGTTADAGQVMADLNALANGLKNAANTGGDTFTGAVQINASFNVGGVGQDQATGLADTTIVASGVATSGTNHQSYTLYFDASYWNGSAAATYSHHISEQPDGKLYIASGAGSSVTIDQNGVIAGGSGNVLQALSGGYKVQSGSVAVGSTANAQGLYSATVTFPTAYSSVVNAVVATGTNVSGSAESITVPTTNLSTSGFTVCSKNSGETVFWISIGQ